MIYSGWAVKLNYLLSLNKKFVLLLTSIFIIIIFLGFFIKYLQTNINGIDEIKINSAKSDIIKPKFSINSENQKIALTAKEGNFISENKILLKNNVIFKSKRFKIISDNVVFDKKNLTASSLVKSKFISKKTSIESNGFEIVDNGNIISFNGKTTLIIKWLKYFYFVLLFFYIL